MAARRRIDDIYNVDSPRSDRLPDAPETGFNHSRYYHKYFRGYTEVRSEKPDGKYAIERVYTQPWIVQDASDSARRLRKAAYLLLMAAAWVFYIRAMTVRDIPETTDRLIALPGVLCAIALFLASACAVAYAFLPRKMTLWEYSSGTKRLRIACLVSAGMLTFTIADALIYIGVKGFAEPAAEIRCLVCLAVAAVDLGAVAILEKRAPYREEENNSAVPAGEIHEIW